eukprot:556213_1
MMSSSESKAESVITKATLHQTHQQQVSEGYNNDNNTVLLIQTMGGMDFVLDKILENDEFVLMQEQIDRIHQIIITPTQCQQQNKYQQNNKIIKLDRNNIQQKEKDDNVHWIMDETDNYLVSLFGEKYAEIILNIIHHKIMYCLLILLGSISMVFYYSLPGIFRIIWYSSCIPYWVLWALSVNKKAFKAIMNTTDFWIKNIYMIIFMVCWNWYHFDGWKYPILLTGAEETLRCISSIPMMVIISSFDGFRGIRKWKITISGIMGIICLFYSIYFQFSSYKNGDDSIIYIYDVGFSLISCIITSLQIIGIFMLNQSIQTFRKKYQAVSIIIRPILIWRNNQKITEKLGVVIQNGLNEDKGDNEDMEMKDVPTKITLNALTTNTKKENSDEDSDEDSDDISM